LEPTDDAKIIDDIEESFDIINDDNIENIDLVENDDIENKEEFDNNTPFDFQAFINKIKAEYSKEAIDDYESVCGIFPDSPEELIFYKNYLRFFLPVQTENFDFNRGLLIQLLAGSTYYDYKFCMSGNNLPELEFKRYCEQEWTSISKLSQPEMKILIEELFICYMKDTLELYKSVAVNSDFADTLCNDKIPSKKEFLSIYGIDDEKTSNLTIDEFFRTDRTNVVELYTRLKEYDLSSYQFRNNDISMIFGV